MRTQRLLGQYMTPDSLADEMLKKVILPVEDWRIFDPACGDGNLLLAASSAMKRAGLQDIATRVMGVDIDPLMVSKARHRLAEVIGCTEDEVKVIEGDFLKMSDSGMLFDSPLKSFTYNTVISNPPYGRLREYSFFEAVNRVSPGGTELVFLMPLAFLDRVSGIEGMPLNGRPMGVTTGHAIIHHITGRPFTIHQVAGLQTTSRSFKVLSGIKLYEVGGGDPPQSEEVVAAKPFSSEERRDGWLPCLRTGDVHPFSIRVGRLWVNYGPHLAHPKELDRFTGPKVFVRRMPVWESRQLGAAYAEEQVLCAGDVLVIRQEQDDRELLKGLCVYLNTPEAAEEVLKQRPSVRYRMSYPKISAKDLNALIEYKAPSDDELRTLACNFEG